ncbi:Lrp/AsnC family transcriptional regulator [Thermohalobacter berrensis]|uniref:AsnC family transcriptional regulator n=1 Tax=Thermohalobacter berrensis TaxID=99594 RepID=A0A419SU86_9FIRM|nr:Lrp/AsnC family transcriptional regulator [Thermohalobacter berrensis]RKD28833.1 AsnC family transcriptional regulator [Thermohalobacter berrensis]
MDSTDCKILEILQTKGRISMKELGKLVALSPPAVAERVKRLEENGIIKGYKAVVDAEKLGRAINVFINVAMKVDKHKGFLEFVNKNDNIVECHHVTGPYCMIIKASLTKMSDLEKLLDQVQEFGDTETFIILSSPVKGKTVKPLVTLDE